MPDIHLKYGGSTALRTIKCPAWHNLSEKAPKIERTSSAAARGTFLHSLMENIYLHDWTLEKAMEAAGEDAEAVEAAHQATEKVLDEMGITDIVVEQFVQVPGTEIGGSADMIIANDTQVGILDYKFGYQPVEDRSQFKLYAYAGEETAEVQDLFADKEFFSVIVQPAVSPEPLGQMHTQDELDDFVDDLLDAIKLVDMGASEGNPGSWCKYCPAAAYCPAKRKQGELFLSLDPEVKEELAAGMAMVADMKEHIKAIEAELFNVLEAGGSVEGWKLVLKQTRRYWADEDKVKHALRYHNKVTKGMYLEEKLKSVAQIEKALKAAGVELDLSELIDNRSTGTTIAPESDKREAVNEIKEMPPALADALGQG